jgi:uncharacterized protein (DUF58 family)
MGLSVCAGGALWIFGYDALDQVWYVAGVALLALVAIALLIVSAAALRMMLALRRPSDVSQASSVSIDTEVLQHTGYSLPSLWLWPFIDVQLSVREPAHVAVRPESQRSQLRERFSMADHGEIREVLRSVEVRDVFGLASLTLRRRGRVSLDVLPHVGALRSLPLLRSLAGGEDVPHPLGIAQGDRLELRRYAPGDPARFIHWKVYARNQKLVVRMPERALSRAHRVAAFLVAGQADGASAAAARVALEERAFGDDFRFGADGTPGATDRVANALGAVRKSAHARPDGGAGLGPFLSTVEREGPVSLILFVPAELGAEREVVREVLARRTRPARVVIGVDGLSRTGQRAFWERLAFTRAESTRLSVATLRETIAFYRRASADVIVLDRRTGRLLSESHFVRGGSKPPAEQAA